MKNTIATQPEWDDTPPEYDLPPGTLHLWQIDLKAAPEQLHAYRGMLAVEEIIRAEQFLLPILTDRFIAAHGAVREILSRYLEREPRELDFDTVANGKPCLAGRFANSGIQFNLSHSHDRALVLVARQMPVGVDIEKSDPNREHLSLAHRYFSTTEFSQLKQLPKEQWSEAFCRCWVGKEAFIKATGEGLKHPLHAFEVDFMGVGDQLLRKANVENLNRWRMQIFLAEGPYWGAWAVEAPLEGQLREVSFLSYTPTQ